MSPHSTGWDSVRRQVLSNSGTLPPQATAYLQTGAGLVNCPVNRPDRDNVAMGHDRRSAAGKAGLPLRGSLVQNDGIRTPIVGLFTNLPCP